MVLVVAGGRFIEPARSLSAATRTCLALGATDRRQEFDGQYAPVRRRPAPPYRGRLWLYVKGLKRGRFRWSVPAGGEKHAPAER